MAYVNVLEWRAEQVAEWMQGEANRERKAHLFLISGLDFVLLPQFVTLSHTIRIEIDQGQV